jgi:hypothetical protein
VNSGRPPKQNMEGMMEQVAEDALIKWTATWKQKRDKARCTKEGDLN